MKSKKVVLTIAGSDSSGGAGIQADLKTFEAFNLFGTSAITVLTAQNTTGVTAIEPLNVSFIQAQIKAVFDDFDVAAVKVGMLFDTPIIKAVEEVIKNLQIPIVIDPVFISKAGSLLLKDEAILALKSLCTYATVITPNNYEAHGLFGYKFADNDTMTEIYDFPTPILIKNHTLQKEDTTYSIDQLFFGRTKKVFTSQKVETSNLHGTGCSFSSAITANLALGHSLETAIEIAKVFIYQSLLTAPKIGHGNGPLNHKAGGEYIAKKYKS
ncbi:MAG: bifunctional hydroxymethylpyrimidine kinase/phosphomethylpyrimidine kinase [Epsilonproteobacteria bacterium]|nr:bifunctional hydroxymethylpyrimidine kinase/phosphomethylpyrimidine kinase [Campylobacterota bacterium]